jgi:hypothetical protein
VFHQQVCREGIAETDLAIMVPLPDRLGQCVVDMQTPVSRQSTARLIALAASGGIITL